MGVAPDRQRERACFAPEEERQRVAGYRRARVAGGCVYGCGVFCLAVCCCFCGVVHLLCCSEKMLCMLCTLVAAARAGGAGCCLWLCYLTVAAGAAADCGIWPWWWRRRPSAKIIPLALQRKYRSTTFNFIFDVKSPSLNGNKKLCRNHIGFAGLNASLNRN